MICPIRVGDFIQPFGRPPDGAEGGKPSRPPTIGILAGMGARSTAPFIDLVVTECQRQYGAYYEDDYPHMMVYSLPTPLRLDQPPDHSAMSASVRAGLKRLADTGADFVSMPCNTVHIYFDELRDAIGVPLLNMIDLAIEAVPAESRMVAPLATSFTMDSGLYQRGLRDLGLEVFEDGQITARVHEILTAVRQSPDQQPARKLWAELLRELQTRGVDTVLLACTDLNPARSSAEPDLCIVDATQRLAEATVASWRRLQ